MRMDDKFWNKTDLQAAERYKSRLRVVQAGTGCVLESSQAHSVRLDTVLRLFFRAKLFCSSDAILIKIN